MFKITRRLPGVDCLAPDKAIQVTIIFISDALFIVL